MNKEKSIPTLLGLLLLGGGLIAGITLTGKNTIFRTKASSDCKPLSPSLTNLTDKSVDISFFTSGECLTTVQANNQIINNLYSGKSKVHYFSVTNLKASTTYSFSLISDGTTYIHDTYKIKTAAKPTGTTPSSNLAWGKIILKNNQPSVKTIVYLNIPNAQPLSAITTSSGNWNISLANSFTANDTGWFTPEDNISEDLIIVTADGRYTQVTGNTSNNSPVPDIIIGNDQLEDSIISPTPILTSTPTPNLSLTTPVNKDFKILNPAEGETISTSKPNFFGTASANTAIQLSIDTASPSAQIYSDNVGSWSWSPSTSLTSGSHFLTAVSQSKTLKRNFIYTEKNLSLPAFTASGSAQLTTPTPILTSTPTPTISPTIRTAKPTVSGTLVNSGVTFFTFIPITLSVILIFISIALLKF